MFIDCSANYPGGEKKKKKENIGKKPTTFKILSAFVVSLSVSLNSVNFAKI